MNHHDQAKKRPLSIEEAGWIDQATETIETSNNAIHGLAEMMIAVAELADAKGIDPYFKDELCRKGVMHLAYGIKSLCAAVSEKQEYINGVLLGYVAAGMQGRRQAIKSIYSSAKHG